MDCDDAYSMSFLMKSFLRFLLALLVLQLFPVEVYGQFVVSPKYEYRAVWLATIKGLDWPKEEARGDAAAQREALCSVLDSLQAINVNTILLQTRIRGDVIYPSEIEPFAPVFTGQHGVGPGYDPLAFAIEECHKRGMQLHAWLVTIPLGDMRYAKGHGRRSLPSRKPGLCTRFNGAWYMEPSHPATAEYLSAIVGEIVSNYDVDGIHFDYIRYPEGNAAYPDDAAYSRARRAMRKDDWRRDNITRLMRTLYNKVKNLKPWVCVSAATLGKYDDTSRYSSYGWNAYHTVYQEAQEWLREGIADALFPMLYYAGNHFYPFVVDWGEHSYGRHIVAGIGTYQLHEDEKDWELEEVARQCHVARAHDSVAGMAQFRSQFVTDNTKGVYDLLRLLSPYPALVPPMPWLNDELPAMPQELEVVVDKHRTTLVWQGHEGARYNVYSSNSYPVDVADPANLVKTYMSDTRYEEYTHSTVYPRHYAVTAIDRYGNESLPLQWENTLVRKVESRTVVPSLN